MDLGEGNFTLKRGNNTQRKRQTVVFTSTGEETEHFLNGTIYGLHYALNHTGHSVDYIPQIKLLKIDLISVEKIKEKKISALISDFQHLLSKMID